MIRDLICVDKFPVILHPSSTLREIEGFYDGLLEILLEDVFLPSLDQEFPGWGAAFNPGRISINENDIVLVHSFRFSDRCAVDGRWKDKFQYKDFDCTTTFFRLNGDVYYVRTIDAIPVDEND